MARFILLAAAVLGLRLVSPIEAAKPPGVVAAYYQPTDFETSIKSSNTTICNGIVYNNQTILTTVECVASDGALCLDPATLKVHVGSEHCRLGGPEMNVLNLSFIPITIRMTFVTGVTILS
jgi:hypothetical protein